GALARGAGDRRAGGTLADGGKARRRATRARGCRARPANDRRLRRTAAAGARAGRAGSGGCRPRRRRPASGPPVRHRRSHRDGLMTLPIPLRHRPALVLAAVLLGLLLSWVGGAGPGCAPLGASRARLAALRIEVGAARREVATRADTKRAVRTAARALRRAAARLPDQRELAVLLASVADGARDARLELLRLHAKPERPAGDHVEVPVELEMRGTYPAAREFLRRLDALGRLGRGGGFFLEGAPAAT